MLGISGNIKMAKMAPAMTRLGMTNRLTRTDSSYIVATPNIVLQCTRKTMRIKKKTKPSAESTRDIDLVKFEVYGKEMIEKEVKQSGSAGRVYLPPQWVGKNVKIIRID